MLGPFQTNMANPEANLSVSASSIPESAAGREDFSRLANHWPLLGFLTRIKTTPVAQNVTDSEGNSVLIRRRNAHICGHFAFKPRLDPQNELVILRMKHWPKDGLVL
jgi:hypothetical protein